MKNVFYSILLAMLTLGQAAHANNITVSNTTTTGQNTSAGVNNAANFTMVQFNLSWENSWRTANGPSNWDAAWVFIKFQVGASNPVFTNASSSGTTVTVSSTANLRVGMPVVVSSGTGAFAANTVISSIANATQFVVSATPSTALNNATIECVRIWEHASLNTTAGNHTAAAGSTIDVPSDGKGVFIYRSTSGSGTNNFSGTQLRWQYGADGVLDDALIQVQVFAIEMVYVPGGVDFNVGGGGGTSAFTSTTINTALANTVPAGSGSLGGQAGGYPTGQNAPNANWPNGYTAFYCMKYEMSQGQYRDFLNTLTYAQQVNRTATMPNSVAGTGAFSSNNDYGNGIAIQAPGNPTSLAPALYGCNLNGNTVFNEATDGEWIACNFLTWMDGCAYVDWAGLRPMTELECEKACRGNLGAVNGELAWGTLSITGVSAITNRGANNEFATNTVANASLTLAPMRVGSFAKAGTGRVQSGATYYGIMEMSGNLWERAVTIDNATGRNYTGVHGDGALSTNGHANGTAWPGLVGTELTAATGSGFRGGGIAIPIAFGGAVTDIVQSGTTYRVHTFSSVGNSDFTVLSPGGLTVEYLIVGGGGGGGRFGGGGGAGGFTSGSIFTNSGVNVVTVGNGGDGGNNNSTIGKVGFNSSFGGVIAYGGGGGGAREGTGAGVATAGASGGGGRPRDSAPYDIGGTNSPAGQGFPGGNGGSPGWGGGGGGGAGAQGGNASGATGGDGGVGLPSSLQYGTNVWYAGGGGGCSYNGGTAGIGGQGGGGSGTGLNNGNGVSGIPNSGGGGGGGGYVGLGGNGGSGIVVLRYPIPADPTPLQVSDRGRATLTETASKNNEGFRGVRSAQ